MPSEYLPEYVPIPSLRHELGIMFGFVTLMLLSIIVYWIYWQELQKKLDRIENERRVRLSKTPLYSGGQDEKRTTNVPDTDDTSYGPVEVSA